MKKLIYGFIMFLMLSCQQKYSFESIPLFNNQSFNTSDSLEVGQKVYSEIQDNELMIKVSSPQQEEFEVFDYSNMPKWMKKMCREGDSFIVAGFIDSLEIGKKGKFKIQLVKWFGRKEYSFQLYKKHKNSWSLVQSDSGFLKASDIPFKPLVYDYNGDGFMDLSFHYSSPARINNEMRLIFLFDPNRDRLIHLKGAEQYCNVFYDPENKWLVSQAFHGGSTTTFLRIIDDSINFIASLEATDHATYLTKNINVDSTISIQIDTVLFDPYVLFKNFDPISIYKVGESEKLKK